MNGADGADELIDLVDDDASSERTHGGDPWTVLIVDDEEQVHQITTYALAEVRILGRPLQFLHAYSAAQARALLEGRPEVAVILLDVVMETDDAGLQLVEHIRVALDRPEVRIILRTGQPGYAPELDVIQRYDINDYRTKSELTHVRLVTILTAALRSYQQIRQIEANRRGLEKVVAASTDLIARRSLATFSEGVLTQLCGLKNLAPEGVIVARLAKAVEQADRDGQAYVVAAAGRFAPLAGRQLDAVPADVILELREAEALRRIHIGKGSAVFPIFPPSGDVVTVYCELAHPMTEDDRQLLEVFATNITVGFDNARLFEDVEFLAYHDSVTGLLNRTGFLRALGFVAGAGSATLAVVELDDHDSLIDMAGDGLAADLRRAVAQRLLGLFTGHHVATVGDARFAVATTDAVDPMTMALSLKAAAEMPVRTPQGALLTGVTIGIAPGGVTMDARGQLQAAALALQEAKRQGRNHMAVYHPGMTADMQERLGILAGWAAAQEAGELELHYQPQVSLTDGSLLGMEALLRWRRADGTHRSPGQFIPVAEEAGIIVEIGEHVLRMACRQIAQWHTEGRQPPPVSVNVSVRQLMVPGFSDKVLKMLDDAGLTGSALRIEVTESAFAPDLKRVRQQIDRLRREGIEVAIDDFGTGFSSLGQVHGLPVDELKLDRTFVHGVDRDPRLAQVAAMAAQLGSALGLRVLAEGIETDSEADTVRALGIDIAQGYLFGRPMPPDAFACTYLGTPPALPGTIDSEPIRHNAGH